MEVSKMSGAGDGSNPYRRLSAPRGTELDDLGLQSAAPNDPERDAPASPSGELAGVYFGILNIFTTLPQFLGTFISTIVFSILEPGQSPELAGDEGGGSKEVAAQDGPNAIAVCLFIGAMCSIVASFVTRKLRVL
jgi:solute carrier family 45 protein 1/2/4